MNSPSILYSDYMLYSDHCMIGFLRLYVVASIGRLRPRLPRRSPPAATGSSSASCSTITEPLAPDRHHNPKTSPSLNTIVLANSTQGRTAWNRRDSQRLSPTLLLTCTRRTGRGHPRTGPARALPLYLNATHSRGACHDCHSND